METDEVETNVDRRLKTLNVLCAALVASILVNGAVAWVVLSQGQLTPGEALAELPILPYLLAAFGFGALVLAPLVSAMVLKQGAGHEPAEPEQVLNRYQSSVIVDFAIRESAAVIGLVATLLTGSMIWVAGLGAAAVLAMVLAWPKKETALSLLKSESSPIG